MLASAISPCQRSSSSRVQSEVSNCILWAHRHALERHGSWARFSKRLSSPQRIRQRLDFWSWSTRTWMGQCKLRLCMATSVLVCLPTTTQGTPISTLRQANLRIQQSARSVGRRWRSRLQCRRCAKLKLIAEMIVLVERCFLSTWQRKARLEKYQPHTQSSKIAFWWDGMAQCWTRRGRYWSTLGCQTNSALKLNPQQSTSWIDYHPDRSPIWCLSKDGCGRNPMSPLFTLLAA